MGLIKVGNSVIKTDAFSNKYETVTTASTSVFNTNFDISSTTVVVYVDGVRQQASAYSVSGARQITLSETVVAGTAVAISAMDTSPVQNLAAKANIDSPTFTTQIVTPKVVGDATGLYLQEDGGKGIFIKDGGNNIGIGTNTPTTGWGVDVANGGVRVMTGGSNQIRFGRKTTSVGYGEVVADANGVRIAVSPDDSTFTTGIQIDQSANVGIGTASPLSKLEVNGPSSANSLCSIGSGSGSSTDKIFRVLRDTSPVTESLTVLRSGNVGINKANPTAALDVAGGLNIEDRLQIWRWAGNMSASSTIRLLTQSGQWLQSYCMVFVKVAAGWQNSAIWDVWLDGYGTGYCVATKKLGDSAYHSVTVGVTDNYGYINLNNAHTAQVAIEVNVYSFSSYATMNYTSSYMTLT